MVISVAFFDIDGVIRHYDPPDAIEARWGLEPGTLTAAAVPQHDSAPFGPSVSHLAVVMHVRRLSRPRPHSAGQVRPAAVADDPHPQPVQGGPSR